MSEYKHYLSSGMLDAVKTDFNFLVQRVVDSGFEYDIQLREDYFNLYFRGNSLGKIEYLRNKGLYRISINDEFVCDGMRKRFRHKFSGGYVSFPVESRQLRAFYSVNNIKTMSARVKSYNYQEEIAFEQMLITDNINRDDLVIIDRQVMDIKKIDILALQRMPNGKYRFLVIEVKLGCNSELKETVYAQVTGYVDRITARFNEYRDGYMENIKQKQGLGLLPGGLKVEIIEGVSGVVVVGGYSGLAEQSIRKLKAKHPDIKVLHIKNHIDLCKCL